MKNSKMIIAAICFTLSTNCIAQSKPKSDEGQSAYKTGIGLRCGWEGGLTIKHFIKSSAAIEGIASRGWGYSGFRITCLYEIQKPLPSANGFAYFYGLGAHLSSYDGRYYGYYGYSGSGYYDKHGNWHPTGYRANYISIGIDLILGIEYKFPSVPFTLGLDIKPFFDFYYGGGRYYDGALSIRYILK